MNVTFLNGLENIKDSLALKIISGTSFCFAVIISFICYSGFIYFEYYGGDPMKRSMKNNLLAQFYLITLIYVYSNVGFIWSVIIGE